MRHLYFIMADELPSVTNPIIPQFREKAMYTEYIDPSLNEKGKNSYSVQSSFKGILRLSPNNINTLTENISVQLSSEELQENISFRDSIADNIELPYLKDGGEAISDDTKRQFLRVSESEGYMLDLCMGSDSIETDNLYIRGMMQTKELIINANEYVKGQETSFKHFVIGDIAMPVYPDGDNIYKGYKEELVKNPIVAPGLSEIADSLDSEDIIEDKSAILVTDGDNNLVYKNSTELINDLILEALMSMESVPTGSIHYFPVTISEYIKLTGAGTHNKKFDSDGNLVEPLIRDYLLCDGSRYYCADFPELAKTLSGTKVSYDVYENEKYSRTEEDINVKDGTFRVPDLRGQFIRSAYLNPNRDESILKDTVGSHRFSQLPMSAPDRVSSDYKSNDNHAHYSFYGSYEPKQFDHSKVKENSQEYIATLGGYSIIGSGSSYTFPGVLSASGRNYNGKENHMPSDHYITAPQEYDATNFNSPNIKANTGVTSENITEVGEVNYENTSLSIYGELAKNLAGYENSPAFIAVLPFIRI